MQLQVVFSFNHAPSLSFLCCCFLFCIMSFKKSIYLAVFSGFYLLQIMNAWLLPFRVQCTSSWTVKHFLHKLIFAESSIISTRSYNEWGNAPGDAFSSIQLAEVQRCRCSYRSMGFSSQRVLVSSTRTCSPHRHSGCTKKAGFPKRLPELSAGEKEKSAKYKNMNGGAHAVFAFGETAATEQAFLIMGGWSPIVADSQSLLIANRYW